MAGEDSAIRQIDNDAEREALPPTRDASRKPVFGQPQTVAYGGRVLYFEFGSRLISVRTEREFNIDSQLPA